MKEAYPERLDLEAVFSVLNGVAKGRTIKDLGFYATFLAKQCGVSFSNPLQSMQDVAQRLLKKYEEFVIRECEIKPDNEDNLMKLYQKLSGILETQNRQSKPYKDGKIWFSPTWAIYTTNYDLSIETTCREAEIELNRGSYYEPATQRHVLKPEMLQGDKFKIIKLHGSLSWYRREDGLMVEYPDGKPSRETEATRIKERLMIYPIEEKAMYEDPYLSLLNSFRDDLGYSPKWLFIGYRFNDPFLLRIIEYSSRAEKQIAIVHPDAEKLKTEKLSQVSGTISTLSGKFGFNESLFENIQNWVKRR